MKTDFGIAIIVVMGVFLASSSFAGDSFLETNVPDSELLMENFAASTYLEMDDYGTMNVPGQPRLPSRIVAVAVPPGAIIENVSVVSERSELLNNKYTIEPVGLILPLMTLTDEELAVYEADYKHQYETIYQVDAFWPESMGWMERNASFRKYKLVDVRINPIQYNPISGQLIQHHGIRINVSYSIPRQVNVIVDYSPRMENLADRIIVNYDEAQEWYSTDNGASRDTHNFVIITTEALVDSVQSLVAFETNVKGKAVYVATVESIDATGTGHDLCEKIRTFLREKYPTSSWGIEDILLVGHHSDVPMRIVKQEVGYGYPLTDFYYAELSGPDSESWDADQDGDYWDDQDPADFYSEVTVGRIPWSDPDLVEAICAKSMVYEMNNDPAFKENILLLGSYFWENTDNAVLMEYIMQQPHMADWSSIRMYEQNSTVYSIYPCDYELTGDNVLDVWPEEHFAFVNLAGHGSYQSVHIMGHGSEAFWASSRCSNLSDDYPSIVFSDACSTSDTSYTNLGQRMLEQGAVGFVGATKVALGSNGWMNPSDGSSQSLDFYFTDAVTSKEYTQGEALQYALIENYQNNGWDLSKYEIAEWNLWGNPDLGMGLAIGSNGSVTMDRETYSSNDSITITLRDIDLNENTGTFETVSLIITTNRNDQETVILTETQEVPGVFIGTILLAESNSVPGNNRLDVLNGQIVIVTYTDSDDGLGGVDVVKTKTAQIDGVTPEIINVHFGRISSDFVEVVWETSEPATCLVEYGDVNLNMTVASSVPSTEHKVVIPDLTPCTFYHFIIRAEDLAGNTITDDNNGLYYRTNTLSIEEIFSEMLESDPGWLMEGQWAFGQPTGQGGEHGYPDPTSGHTGQNVYGYNLDGDYPNNSAAYTLTTQALNCAGMENVVLAYWRWLGVERNMYDNASIEVSTDGTTFVEVWENADIEHADSVWTHHVLDISEQADNQQSVYIRWVMGRTDQGWHYCGWNIDDISLTSTAPCNLATPTPRPTATPEPSTMPATGIHLMMTDTSLVEGDMFNLTYLLRNGMASVMTVDVFIALEVYGSYWFWPTWVGMDEGIAFDPAVSVAAASETNGDALQFTWPNIEGRAPGLFFYGLLLNTSNSQIMGDLSWVCWEYR
ncbi:hypothetical protein K8T06_10215 [bacterium]|nr:hypothetical protein [bacterium]